MKRAGCRRRRLVRSLIVALAASSLVTACTADDPTGRAGERAVVRVAVLPDQAVASLESQYAPLLAYLDGTAGVRTELVIPTDYADLVARFRRGEVELAWFGGLTFLRSDLDGDADPLAMRDVDLDFTSDFLVAADASGDRIEDFGGLRFAFGPRLSTSGHLMPRSLLQRDGIVPEEVFASVAYSAGHDETALWVRDGVVDVGVANSVVVESMFRSGELSPDDVRVVDRTTPYRDYTWATRSDLDEGVRIRLLDALLALDPTRAGDRAILSTVGAGGFVPATRSDFDELRMVADELGLLDGDVGS